MKHDFIEAMVNDPDDRRNSERLRNRLTTDSGSINGLDGLLNWMIARQIEKLPEEARAAAWERVKDVRSKRGKLTP